MKKIYNFKEFVNESYNVEYYLISVAKFHNGLNNL